jgi:WD40 repeat protein
MKYVFLALAIFSEIAMSSPHKDCKTIQPNADEVFQELAYTEGLACIYSTTDNDGYATISFFEEVLGSYKRIAENNTLIQLQDMQQNQPVIDAIDKARFQIIYEYPRDIYVIELESSKHSIKIASIHKSIKLSSLTTEGTPLIVDFSASEAKIETMSFNTLDENQAFGKETLELASSSIEKIIPITADRSALFIKPDTMHKSKSYLIKGDNVMLLKAKKEWLLVRYTNQKNISVDRWIMLSDVL